MGKDTPELHKIISGSGKVLPYSAKKTGTFVPKTLIFALLKLFSSTFWPYSMQKQYS